MPKGFSKTNFLNSDVPEVVLNRLPIYLRILNQLQQQQVKVTTSKELATYMTVEPSQIRKDLTYIGRFGLNGKGYSVKTLKNNLLSSIILKDIMGSDHAPIVLEMNN